MDTVPFLLRGSLIGLSVTAPVGPMGVLCISRTLAGGAPSGLATGAGATTVQAAYALVLLLGVQWIGPWLDGNRSALSLAGSALMLVFAGCLFRRRGPRLGRRAPGLSLAGAFVSAIAFNLVNPMLVVVLLGSFAVFIGPDPLDGRDAALVLLGLCAGSGAWWLLLNGMAALLRGRMNAAALHVANRVTAGLLGVFGLLALAHALPS